MIVGLRHAEVSNPGNVVYARLPGFHLSERGRREARGLGAALAGAPVRAVYASPLDRAVETATALAEPHEVPVVVDDRLVEWSFWVRWQGMPWTDIRSRDPELLTVYGNDPGHAGADDPLSAAGARLLGWAEDADAGSPEGLVLGVTHEAPLVAATILGRGEDLSGYHRWNLPHLAAVRLRPGPPEVVDLAAWASAC